MDLIVFDLGNVVLRYDPVAKERAWSQRFGLELGEVRQRFRSPAVLEFETGRITARAFCEAMRGAAGLDFSCDEFFEGWSAGFSVVMPGIETVLLELKRAGRKLVALSNTDPVHYETVIRSRFAATLASFDTVFCSHEIGFRKPDPGAYAAVEDRTGTAPQRILFLDDLSENVAAARHRGWSAVQVANTDQIRRAIERHTGMELALREQAD
jgi:epoxide hydrolase-like predicted phosphatase